MPINYVDNILAVVNPPPPTSRTTHRHLDIIIVVAEARSRTIHGCLSLHLLQPRLTSWLIKSDPHITSYVNHVSSHSNARKAQHAIVLDIYALTFPTGRQQLNDSGATSAVEMFFEIKTFTSQKFHYVQKLIMLIFSQWIGGLMRLSCLMTASSKSWTLFLLLMLLVTTAPLMWLNPLQRRR
jgi:hypothetical protein